VSREDAKPAAGAAGVRLQNNRAYTLVSDAGKFTCAMCSSDVSEARAAAERLTRERG
jgi:hypothetical protein